MGTIIGEGITFDDVLLVPNEQRIKSVWGEANPCA